MKIEFTNSQEYERHFSTHLKHLKEGDIIINGFHNPTFPGVKAGIYLVLRAYNELLDLQESMFVVNLRSTTTYTYNYMVNRFTKSGFYMADVESLQISIRKNK